MISAVDTNVIIDVLRDDPRFGGPSTDALRRASAEGRLIVAPLVWAEICAAYDDSARAGADLDSMGIELVPDDLMSASTAGAAWREYRRAGGTRRRLLADFMIAAHAERHADRLVTRDRGFYRTHFKSLRILDPTT